MLSLPLNCGKQKVRENILLNICFNVLMFFKQKNRMLFMVITIFLNKLKHNRLTLTTWSQNCSFFMFESKFLQKNLNKNKIPELSVKVLDLRCGLTWALLLYENVCRNPAGFTDEYLHNQTSPLDTPPLHRGSSTPLTTGCTRLDSSLVIHLQNCSTQLLVGFLHCS